MMSSLRGIRHERALLRWRWVWVPIVGVTVIGLALNIGGLGRTTSVIIGVVAMALGQGLAERRRNVVIERLRAMGGCCCAGCGYGLASLGDEGVCPECGEAFSIDATRAAWTRALGLHPESIRWDRASR